MSDRSLPGDPRFSASAPGSEATSCSLDNQRKSERSLSASTDETPAEHIRNALQILKTGLELGERDTFPRTDVEAIRRRLRLALEALESARVFTGQTLSQYMAELATNAPGRHIDVAAAVVGLPGRYDDLRDYEIPVKVSRDFPLDSSRGVNTGRRAPRDERTLTRAVELERRGWRPRIRTVVLGTFALLAGALLGRTLEGWL